MKQAVTFQLVMKDNVGGQPPIPAAPATRGNVIVFPSGRQHAGSITMPFPADTNPAAVTAVAAGTMDGRGEELLQLENCWLDLTSDIASFMELSEIPEVVKEDVVLSSPISPSFFLPNIVAEMDLKGDMDEDDATATELLMNANMKILDNFIMESSMNNIDDSVDSFSSDLDSNQSLIDEVESYLLTESGGEPTIIPVEEATAEIEYQGVLCAPATNRGQENLLKEIETSLAEKNRSILKALVAGKVLAADNRSGLNTMSSDLSLELSEEDLANAYTTTIKTENGQDVIIIIAQPGGGGGGVSPPSSSSRRDLESLSSYSFSGVGSPGYTSSVSSDYEWSPAPSQPAGQPQRKKYQRKSRPMLSVEPYPREKTERKKAQNRTAAFRYREKKKAEVDAVDSELEQLREKNSALKARHRDMEQEFRCLKRLIEETGLGHLIREATFI